MTISMTAFARGEQELSDCLLIWEIRTVNHRYLDINLKLADELRHLDSACRQQISSKLSRGRVDAQLKLENLATGSKDLAIDGDLANRVAQILRQIEEQNPGVGAASSTDILRWPGVIKDAASDIGERREHCLTTLNTALQSLVEERKREGGRLGEIILEKVSQCEAIHAGFVENIADIQAKIRQKWQKRVDEIAVNVDADRMAQEIAILLTRSDVVEELDRLATHLTETRKLVNAKKPKGRNLDFLMQELNREANTLGSKSIDERMTNASIDLKVLIDQMREQVQNIE